MGVKRAVISEGFPSVRLERPYTPDQTINFKRGSRQRISEEESGQGFSIGSSDCNLSRYYWDFLCLEEQPIGGKIARNTRQLQNDCADS